MMWMMMVEKDKYNLVEMVWSGKTGYIHGRNGMVLMGRDR